MTSRSPSIPLPAGFPRPDERNGYRMLLDMIVRGTSPDPPVIRTLKPPRPAEWSPGALTVHATLSEDHTWSSGIIFGGYLACLLDLYGGLVLLTILPDRAAVLTGTLDIAFPAPTTPGPVRIDAMVAKVSDCRALTEVTITQYGLVTSRGRATQVIRQAAGPVRSSAGKAAGWRPSGVARRRAPEQVIWESKEEQCRLYANRGIAPVRLLQLSR
jgi:acyl-coenzyme A thioesterase PaaI-like protein